MTKVLSLTEVCSPGLAMIADNGDLVTVSTGLEAVGIPVK